jgi:hypothetical protein
MNGMVALRAQRKTLLRRQGLDFYENPGVPTSLRVPADGNAFEARRLDGGNEVSACFISQIGSDYETVPRGYTKKNFFFICPLLSCNDEVTQTCIAQCGINCELSQQIGFSMMQDDHGHCVTQRRQASQHND